MYYSYNIIILSLFFFIKQKTANEWLISDWSSDVCSADLYDMAKYREVLREAPNTQCIVYRATHNPRQSYTYTWSGYTGTPVPVVYPMETPFRVTVDLGQ